MKKQIIFICVLLCFSASVMLLRANRNAEPQTSVNKEISYSDKVQYYISLSKFYLDSAISRSEHYGKKALFLANQTDDTKLRADALYNMGEVFYVSGEYERAGQFFHAARKHYQTMSDFSGTGNCFTGLAKIMNWQGKYEESVNLAFYAIRLFQYNHDYSGIAKAYNTIGIAYDKNNLTDKAIRYYHSAFNMFLKVNDLQGMANTMNNLAIIYGKKDRLSESLGLFQQSLSINRQLKNERTEAAILNNIGNIYRTKGNYSEAEKCFRESKKINRSLSNKKGLLFSDLNLATLYLETNRLQSSVFYLDRASSIALELNQLPQLAECYEKYSIVYEKSGNFQKSLEYFRKYKEIDDSLRNKEIYENIRQKDEHFLSEANRNSHEMQKKDNEILTLKLDRSVWLRNFILGALVSISTFMMLLYMQYRTKAKSNEYLAKLNKDLSDANMRLIESETKLMEWNSTKDKFFSIISHDLRNPIASLVSFVRIMNRDIDFMTKEEIGQLVSDMKSTIERAQELLENLLLWSKTQTGKIMFQPERFNFYEAVHENVHLFQSALSQKQISIKIFIENPTFIFGDFNMIRTIVRNLLSNAIKFTKLKGNIKFYYEESSQFHIFRIEDDGVGMKPEEINLLFTPGGQRSKQGTADEKGSGIGLLICREFIDKHNGHIEIFSEPGKGSIFSVFIPTKTE